MASDRLKNFAAYLLGATRLMMIKGNTKANEQSGSLSLSTIPTEGPLQTIALEVAMVREWLQLLSDLGTTCFCPRLGEQTLLNSSLWTFMGHAWHPVSERKILRHTLHVLGRGSVNGRRGRRARRPLAPSNVFPVPRKTEKAFEGRTKARHCGEGKGHGEKQAPSPCHGRLGRHKNLLTSRRCRQTIF